MTMRVEKLRAFIYFAGLALALPAAAQERSGNADTQQVLVEGRKNLKKDIRDFVGAVTAQPHTRQLSRFEQGVCPAVVGLPQGAQEKVVARLRRVAKAADMLVADADCRPNVMVIVTTDKVAFMRAVLEEYPSFFWGMTKLQARKLIETPGPVAAWQVPGITMSADGSLIPLDGNPSVTYGSTGIATRTTTYASRIKPATRSEFLASIVVVEGDAIDGRTTTQLADYAAMRAFAATDPSRLIAAATVPTILTLLDPASTSATLSRWDLGILRGLYREKNDAQWAGAQRDDMSREVARQVEQAAKH
ncbi:hypothetical protein LQ953_04935 [Sphingomonas sp. IC-56]|uniref:hypothetical protein n=1 Tax=Sphingomonas sp. IC-56 TaxID=2898529 RepID=UPI001E3F3FA7|nr:hypothetical protein [Sphingomonas sp. IC-56]MCD2323358.1 hypothetical protein [Sphingomonas sp. IC-56]